MTKDHLDNDTTGTAIGRRGLLIGAGVTAAASAAALAMAPAASAQVAPRRGSSSKIKPQNSAVPATIASAPVSGWVYRHASMFDFSIESGSSVRYWGGYGVYAAGSTLHATVEIPAGARIRDVEWYVYNTSAGSVIGSARLWRAGSGFLDVSVVETTIHTSGGAIVAVRSTAPSSTAGPFPLGTKLDLGIGQVDSTVQVNGCRVGFDLGAGDTGLLSTPVRAYDSRVSGGRFHAGETRTITLPAAAVVPGTAGVLLNVTAVNGSRGGYLKVYSAAHGEPGASSLNFSNGPAVANGVISAISSGRQLKIKSNKAVDVVVDVTGTIA